MYFSLLFAVPMIQAEISGVGVIGHFFTMHYSRLLALALLLPAFLHMRMQPDTEPFGRSIYDKLFLGFFLLQFLLMLSATSFTDSLRQRVFYVFIDAFLPYYVASRALKNLQEFRDALMSFAVAVMVLAAIAVFELWSHWLLYASLGDALGVGWGYGSYLERETGGPLRAQVTTGQPIALGYVMAVAVGLFLCLRRWSSNSAYWILGLALLVAGLIAAISRGPWLGTVVMLLIFIMTGPAPVRRSLMLGLFAVVLLAVLAATPLGDKVVKYLPFVGTVEEENVTGRQRLLQIAISVISDNPFFGAYDYMYRFDEMRHGDAGFIDFVNTYVVIGLSSGLVGLSLFIGFFLLIAAGIFRSIRGLADRNSDLHVLGQALLSTLIGIMLIIFTTSSITVIPLVYWALAGVGVAYLRMVAVAKNPLTIHEPLPSVRARPETRSVRSFAHYGK